MKNLNLVQVGFFKPLLDRMSEDGIRTARAMRQSGIDRFRLDSHESYVPANCMYALFEQLCRQEGDAHLGERYSEAMLLEAISDCGMVIADQPDILTSCMSACKNDRIMITEEYINFYINGHLSVLSVQWKDVPMEGRNVAETINLALAVNSFHAAVGTSWEPQEIHLQQTQMPDLTRVLPKGKNVKVKLGQSAMRVVFPSSDLSARYANKVSARSSELALSRPGNLAEKIEILLDASIPGHIPGLKMVAEMAEVSDRTLQRKLREEQTTFFEVVDQWRLKRSINLLERTDLTVCEVGEQVGYTNTPNFERAFKRWTQTTPQAYRQA